MLVRYFWETSQRRKTFHLRLNLVFEYFSYFFIRLLLPYIFLCMFLFSVFLVSLKECQLTNKKLRKLNKVSIWVFIMNEISSGNCYCPGPVSLFCQQPPVHWVFSLGIGGQWSWQSQVCYCWYNQGQGGNRFTTMFFLFKHKGEQQ